LKSTIYENAIENELPHWQVNVAAHFLWHDVTGCTHHQCKYA